MSGVPRGPGRPGQPARPFWRTRLGLTVVLACLALPTAVAFVMAAFTTQRFAGHSAIADAVILDTPHLGCVSANGGGQAYGGGITRYHIRFDTASGPHEGFVERPCNVIPPDFGRGRGAIWIEYDVDDPDRTRVLGDKRAETTFAVTGPVLTVEVIGFGTLLLLRRSTRPTHPDPR